MTRELYLCGTCSVEFTSVNECKAHMTEVGGVDYTPFLYFEKKILNGVNSLNVVG